MSDRLRALVVYVIVAYAGGVLVDVCFRLLGYSFWSGGLYFPLLWGLARMYTPALAAVLACIYVGYSVRRRLLLVIPKFVWSYFITPLIAYAVVSLALLISVGLGHPPVIPTTLPLGYGEAVAVLVLEAYLASITINSFYALGEEVGWRGLLQGLLEEKFSLLKSSLLVGLVWGYWHAPAFFIVGFYTANYHASFTEALIASLLLFPVFTIGLALCLAVIRRLWRSVLPCASFHGGINALGGLITTTGFRLVPSLAILAASSLIIGFTLYYAVKRIGGVA